MTHPSPSKAINAPGASPWEWDHFDLILGLAEDLLPVVAREGVISPDSKIAHWGKTPSEYNRRGQIRGILAWPQMHDFQCRPFTLQIVELRRIYLTLLINLL